MRDRLGRLHCDCGLVMGKVKQEFPDGKTEEYYWCRRCFSEYGYDAYIPMEIADREFPDWSKKRREELKSKRRLYRKTGLV